MAHQLLKAVASHCSDRTACRRHASHPFPEVEHNDEGGSMNFKSKWFMLGLAVLLGLTVLFLPRPEGTRFRIVGGADKALLPQVGDIFRLVSGGEGPGEGYLVETISPGTVVVIPPGRWVWERWGFGGVAGMGRQSALRADSRSG